MIAVPAARLGGILAAAVLVLLGALSGETLHADESEAMPDDDVVVTSWVVWIDRVEHVVVQHDLQVENRGGDDWHGEPLEGTDDRAVITVPLPPGAAGFETLGRFTECCATTHDGFYVHTTPLPPGTSTGTLRYRVETLETLELPVRLPVHALTLMVPDGVRVDGPRLEPAGHTESRGTRYEMHAVVGLKPGEVLDVSFDGLALQGTPGWHFALAGLAAALVAAVGLIATVRWRRSSGTKALSRAALIDELALLDVGLERGLLDPQTYAALREVRRAELDEQEPGARG